MPYMFEVCVAGNTIEVTKYYSVRYHSKGEKREKKEIPSSEAQKRINQRNAETKLRRILNSNFHDGDFLVRLDFYKANAPNGSEDMQEIMSKVTRQLRNEFRKVGQELKYVYVKEIGPRGGRHIHMVMSKCDIDIIRKVWPYGGIHVDPLNTKGQYGKIAAYFIKYAAKTEETEGKLIGKRWYPSKNLEKPKIIKKVVSANEFRKKATELTKYPGYQVDFDSVRNGISDYTGYEYFSYTLIRAG